MRFCVGRFSTAAARACLVTAALTLAAGGCYLLGPEQYHESRELDWQRGFGYAGAGFVPWASFFGEIQGVGPGTGFSLYVPPLVPVQAVTVLTVSLAVALPIAMMEAAGQGDGSATAEVFVGTVEGVGEIVMPPESTRWGVSDPKAEFISERSIELGLSHTQHQDEKFGGGLSYTSLLLGARLAGPRFRIPRIYVNGGFGWHWFEYDNRPDASVPGPYLGIGAEFFGGRERVSTVFRYTSATIEYRASFYFGDDEAGEPVDGGAQQLAVILGFYW